MQNPANAGMGKGYNRGNLDYHTQHPSMGKVYTTMYASIDAPIFSHKMKANNAFLGAGLFFYNDKAGDSQLSNLKTGLSLSGIVDLDYWNKASVGIQGAFMQQSYTTADIQWDNQYNGTTYDPSLPSGENFTGDKSIGFNLSTGVLWQHFARDQNLSGIDKGSFQVGYGAFNLLRPNKSILQSTDRLFVRHVLHGRGLVNLAETHWGLAPRAYFMTQGPHKEFAIGSDLLYFFKGDTKYTGFIKEMYLGFSLMYRHTDAIIPGIVFKFDDFILGLSYDYSVGQVYQYNRGNGGFEISIQFNDTYGTLFNQGNKHVINSSRQMRQL